MQVEIKLEMDILYINIVYVFILTIPVKQFSYNKSPFTEQIIYFNKINTKMYKSTITNNMSYINIMHYYLVGY